MHMLLVIVGGAVLLGVFLLFGKLWGGDPAGMATGARLFVPAWLVVALVNMWVGVNKAGYTVAEELPILLVVFAVQGVAMGLSITPVTDLIMGALPTERAGVASALNDVSRQVGGAVGVAVLGQAPTEPVGAGAPASSPPISRR